jgi:MGT family glycosyltransferase
VTQSVVVVCVPGHGHWQRFVPLIEMIAARGRIVHVMTHARFRAGVERASGRFFDLYGRYPVEAADATSLPLPSRLVTFAGVYAERLAEDVASLAPALIIYDTFAVVAPVIARRLGLPYVNVCSGHAAVPSRVLAELRQDPRVAISAECWAAVRRLREVHGMAHASPFSYVEAQSPFLNLYGEPPEFLDDEERAAFEPIAYFGSLAPSFQEASPSSAFSSRRRALRLYVSFGTVIWRYYAEEACAALAVISGAAAELDADVVISLGRHRIEAGLRTSLARPNVQVVDYIDQWAVLGETDVFITHHGLNSTHEAIYHEVPMLSYPFFGDQPALARRCQDLGLALSLVPAPRSPLARGVLEQGIERLAGERQHLAARLAEARSWELRTIAEREAVIDRVLALDAAPSR